MSDIEKKHHAIKIDFFNELLKLLETISWSEDLINLAESNIRLNSGYRHIIFPSGIQEIICSFEEWLDGCMLEQLSHLDEPKKIRDKIALALEIRILGVIPQKALLSSCGYYLVPTNIIAGTESACHSCDIIWKYAGDKSTDFNYYTKRGLLLGVYLGARAFYFADNSENHEDTRKFIKNALDNIINIASFKNNIKMPKMEDIPIIRLFS
jgi:ubiquinone biosynthesis protein COQ9